MHTGSQWSESDEDQFSLSIFGVFNEIEITGDNNWMHGTLSLGAFGDENYHIMVRSVVCDYIHAHRSRSKEFITERYCDLSEGNEEAQVMGSKYRTDGIQWTLWI